MTKKIYLMAAILSIAGWLIAADSAFAQHGGHGGGHGGGGHGGGHAHVAHGGGGHASGGHGGGGHARVGHVGGGGHGRVGHGGGHAHVGHVGVGNHASVGHAGGGHAGVRRGGGYHNGYYHNGNRHNYYRGGYGYRRGYGYYSGDFGGYYPWYDNGGWYDNYPSDSYYDYPPASYDDESPYVAPAATAVSPAYIEVLVPNPQATVWFDGSLTTQTGTDRLFHTPPLTMGSAYSYRIRASWMEGGRAVTQARLVTVSPGQTATVDFTR